jgi:probable rRNA maturation factor
VTELTRPPRAATGVAAAPQVEVRWAGRPLSAPPARRASHSAPAAAPQGLLPLLEEFGRRVLERLRRPVEVSVLLCDGAAMRVLNARYRGIDAPTDVLSFGQLEDTAVPGVGAAYQAPAADAVAPCAPPVAGDVVIAVDVAARQATARGEPLERELCRLLVHGMLHLMGMDHADPPAEDEPMLSLQEQMLDDLPWDVGPFRHLVVEEEDGVPGEAARQSGCGRG